MLLVGRVAASRVTAVQYDRSGALIRLTDEDGSPEFWNLAALPDTSGVHTDSVAFVPPTPPRLEWEIEVDFSEGTATPISVASRADGTAIEFPEEALGAFENDDSPEITASAVIGDGSRLIVAIGNQFSTTLALFDEVTSESDVIHQLTVNDLDDLVFTDRGDLSQVQFEEIAVSQDGRLVAAADTRGVVRLFRLENGVASFAGQIRSEAPRPTAA